MRGDKVIDLIPTSFFAAMPLSLWYLYVAQHMLPRTRHGWRHVLFHANNNISCPASVYLKLSLLLLYFDSMSIEKGICRYCNDLPVEVRMMSFELN